MAYEPEIIIQPKSYISVALLFDDLASILIVPALSSSPGQSPETAPAIDPL
jgi:hypothetical protein